MDYISALNVLYTEVPESDKFRLIDSVNSTFENKYISILNFKVHKSKFSHKITFNAITDTGAVNDHSIDMHDNVVSDPVKRLINHDISMLQKLRRMQGEFKVTELVSRSSEVDVLRRVLMPPIYMPLNETGMFRTITLVCSIGEAVVGYVEYYRRDGCRNGIYIKTLVSINKGGGKAMIRHLISKYDVISLDVMDDGSGKLYDYYESLGFREDYEDGKYTLNTKGLQCKK